MRKEMVIVIIIVISVVIINIITDNYTDSSIFTMNNKLEEIYNIAITNLEKDVKKDENAIRKMNDLRDQWNNINRKLAFYIEHDEIEKVDTSIVEINEYIYLGLYDEAIPEIKKCSFILDHIKHKGRLQIINLF